MLLRCKKGFSLIEGLVVLAVFTLAFTPLMMGFRHGVTNFAKEVQGVEMTQSARKTMEYIMDRIRRHDKSDVDVEIDYDGAEDRLIVGKYRYYIKDEILIEEYEDGEVSVNNLNEFIDSFQILDVVTIDDRLSSFVIELRSDDKISEKKFTINTEIYLRGD